MHCLYLWYSSIKTHFLSLSLNLRLKEKVVFLCILNDLKSTYFEILGRQPEQPKQRCATFDCVRFCLDKPACLRIFQIQPKLLKILKRQCCLLLPDCVPGWMRYALEIGLTQDWQIGRQGAMTSKESEPSGETTHLFHPSTPTNSDEEWQILKSMSKRWQAMAHPDKSAL